MGPSTHVIDPCFSNAHATGTSIRLCHYSQNGVRLFAEHLSGSAVHVSDPGKGLRVLFQKGLSCDFNILIIMMIDVPSVPSCSLILVVNP